MFARQARISYPSDSSHEAYQKPRPMKPVTSNRVATANLQNDARRGEFFHLQGQLFEEGGNPRHGIIITSSTGGGWLMLHKQTGAPLQKRKKLPGRSAMICAGEGCDVMPDAPGGD